LPRNQINSSAAGDSAVGVASVVVVVELEIEEVGVVVVVAVVVVVVVEDKEEEEEGDNEELGRLEEKMDGGDPEPTEDSMSSELLNSETEEENFLKGTELVVVGCTGSHIDAYDRDFET
jgi:hypothetical protein